MGAYFGGLMVMLGLFLVAGSLDKIAREIREFNFNERWK